MISLKQPALAVNSCDVPGPDYTMWDTWDAPEGTSAADLVARTIASQIRATTQGKRLVNLVINCHGYPGGLWIGGRNSNADSLNTNNVSTLAALKLFHISTIWLVACNAALDNWAKSFCKLMAQTTGAQVVAAEDEQEVGFWDGAKLVLHEPTIDTDSPSVVYKGEIDEFEGTTYLFEPTGHFFLYDEDMVRGVEE